jgi:hypothetical protein
MFLRTRYKKVIITAIQIFMTTYNVANTYVTALWGTLRNDHLVRECHESM